MSNKKVKDTYAYKYMSIYLDVSNPYQKECYELLQMINKKKSLFLGMLAHNFIQQFKGSVDAITPEDLKKYITSYEFISQFKSTAPNMVMPPFNTSSEHIEPLVKKPSANPASETVSQKIPASEVKPLLEVQEEPVEDDMDYDSLAACMDMFSATSA